MVTFAPIGMGDMVCVNRVLAIIKPQTSSAKRYVANAKELNKYI